MRAPNLCDIDATNAVNTWTGRGRMPHLDDSRYEGRAGEEG
jgi:DNA-binding protein H-NS